MKNIMKRAHELAKQMEGNNYRARLTLALVEAWEESKMEQNNSKVVRYNTLSVAKCKELYGLCPSDIKGGYHLVSIGEAWVLPALTGTEKQVEWALSIRGSYVRKAEGYINRKATDENKKAEAFDNLEALLNKNVDAKFWIDNRDRF